MVWRGIVFHTCGILTDGFSAGFWKHMQYFKHNSEHSSVSTFFSTQEMLQYIQITYQPSCKADTHVSIVDVEHVNLCWRFNSLDACSVPTERERDRGEVSISLNDQREKQVQFNPKALDILMKKFATK